MDRKRRIGKVADVAKLTGYQPSTIYEFVSQRKIPHLKIFHGVRFDLDEVEAWLDSKRVPAASGRDSARPEV
jgi:excisionase family DNA binding protein